MSRHFVFFFVSCVAAWGLLGCTCERRPILEAATELPSDASTDASRDTELVSDIRREIVPDIASGEVACTAPADPTVPRATKLRRLWKSLGDVSVSALVVGKSGDVYLTGHAEAHFFSPVPQRKSREGLYVAKVSKEGSLLWLQRAGQSKLDVGLALALDASESTLYVTGTHASSLQFSNGAMIETLPQQAGVFVAAFDAEKGAISATTGVSFEASTQKYSAIGASIAVAPSGAVYVVGSYQGNLCLQGNRCPGMASAFRPFVAAFSASLVPNWIKPYNTTDSGQDSGVSVVVTSSGHIAVLGEFENASQVEGKLLSSQGRRSLFLVVLDERGVVHRSPIVLGSSSKPTGRLAGGGMIAGPKNGLYVSGSFVGSASFGGVVLKSNLSSEARDYFVLRYSLDAKQTTWAASSGAEGTGEFVGKALALSPAGLLCLVGSTTAVRPRFGRIPASATPGSRAKRAAFVACLDANNKAGGERHKWASVSFSSDSASVHDGAAVGISREERVWIGGSFVGLMGWQGGQTARSTAGAGMPADGFLLSLCGRW